MPFISDTAMEKVATKLQGYEKRKIEVRQKLSEAKVVAESSLGAALVGFMHGWFEDADANFLIPRTSIPADFAMGLTGVGLAFFDMFGRADEDVLNFSNGVLSGATAMYFRDDKGGRPDLLRFRALSVGWKALDENPMSE